MKLSKLKRLLNEIAVFGNYFVHRKCLLEDIVVDNSSSTCKDCKYRCFNSCCTAIGMSVLK